MDDDSDGEGLPKQSRPKILRITSKEYLKLFQMKNPMHDLDREKSQSIISNLVMPDPIVMKRNPYLNHELEEEPNVDLSNRELKIY